MDRTKFPRSFESFMTLIETFASPCQTQSTSAGHLESSTLRIEISAPLASRTLSPTWTSKGTSRLRPIVIGDPMLPKTVCPTSRQKTSVRVRMTIFVFRLCLM